MNPADFLRATQGLAIDGATRLFTIDDPLRKMVVYRSGDVLIAGFAGTRDGLLDWLLNFWFWPVRTDVAGISLRAHPGALLEARTILPVILDHATGIRRFLLSGHSQGGAHAVDVALWLSGLRPRCPIEVVTFGAMPALTTSSVRAVATAPQFHQVQFTNYLLSGDPMGMIPWGVLGLGSPGDSVLLEPKRTWPDASRHSPSAYLQAFEPSLIGL